MNSISKPFASDKSVDHTGVTRASQWLSTSGNVVPLPLKPRSTVAASDFKLMDGYLKPQAVFLKPVKNHRGQTWYHMDVRLEGFEEPFRLVNRSQRPRRWRHLEAIASFVAHTFPTLSAFSVEVLRTETM